MFLKCCINLEVPSLEELVKAAAEYSGKEIAELDVSDVTEYIENNIHSVRNSSDVFKVCGLETDGHLIDMFDVKSLYEVRDCIIGLKEDV